MLKRIAAKQENDFETRRRKATGLTAIGADEEAIAVYEGLVAERPSDRSLLADYVAMLIETERFGRAEQLLRQNWPASPQPVVQRSYIFQIRQSGACAMDSLNIKNCSDYSL